MPAHMMTEYGVPIVALKLWRGEGSYLIDTTHSITAKDPAFQVDVIRHPQEPETRTAGWFHLQDA